MVVSSLAVKISKQNFFAGISKSHWGPLFVKCICGTIAFFSIALAVKNIPLSIYQVIANTLPFMIAIIVFCWLRESITKFELGAMCFCIGGIILVAMDE